VGVRLYHKVLGSPLFLFSVFGILGVLVDADHLIEGRGRASMVPILILCWLFCVSVGSHSVRLVHKLGVNK
jgi:hypothetical protein